MKKSTGWIIFGVAAGVACGVGYYVYKNKDKFIKEEIDVTPEGEIVTKRKYVGIDAEDIKAKASDVATKTKKFAKDTAAKVSNKIEDIKASGFELANEVEETIYEDFTSVVEKDEEVPEAEFVTFDIKADAKASEEADKTSEEE